MYVNARALIERVKGDQAELFLQIRNKPYEGGTSVELPGGRVKEYESLIDALRREVCEETGLELSFVQGLESRIETNGADANVECLQPFAVYQTLRGPVDSVGVYFLCWAEGKLAESGDETEHPRWMLVSEIALRLEENPELFSFVDRAGLAYYLKHK